MKRSIINASLLLAMLFGAAACDSGSTAPEPPEGREIRLSGSGNGIKADVGRASAFPNTNIGVLAGYYKDLGSIYTTDWTAYGNVQNEMAYPVSTATEGLFGFSWKNGPKYWPMDDTRLVFMAYSPYTDNSIVNGPANIRIQANNHILAIDLIEEDMQDVMYASLNTEYKPFTKADGTVDLGTFKHALSQLTVEVVADQSMSPSTLYVTDLRVSTNRTEAFLDLTLGDDGLSFPDPAAEDMTFKLVDETTPFSYGDSISRTVMMFPGTQDDVRIDLQLSDGGSSYVQGTYSIADFPQAGSGAPLSLQRGKNTTIRFRVERISVNPTDLDLEGTLVDWHPGGSLGVVIE